MAAAESIALSKDEVRQLCRTPIKALRAEDVVGGRYLSAESVALFLMQKASRGKAITRRPGFPPPAYHDAAGIPMWDMTAVDGWAANHRHADPATQATCLYRHFDANGALLYVGISATAMQRQAQHRHGSAWFRQVVNITVEWFDARAEAEAAELRAIREEHPMHNTQGRPNDR